MRTHALVFSYFLLSMLFICARTYPVSASTVTTKNPSASYGSKNWFNPQNAYVSDDAYAQCSRTGNNRHYHDYDFDSELNASHRIDKVEVGVEHYESGSTQRILVAVSVDGGNDYTHNAILYSGSDLLEWVDFTHATPSIDWTYDDLYDENFRVRVSYGTLGGCYANNTFLVVYDEKSEVYSIESAGEIVLGDSILAWNKPRGVHIAEVNNITVHHGDWVMRDFYSGNLTINVFSESVIWEKHLAVTSEHPMFDVDTDARKSANEVTTDDAFYHLDRGKLIDLPITKVETWNYTGEVYNIGVNGNETCIFAKSFTERELKLLSNIKDWKFIGAFDNIVMAIKVPWTTYLDWLPVRVTYTLKIPSIVCIPCLFMGIVFVGSLTGLGAFLLFRKRE